MRIASFQIENYKSIHSSPEIELLPGFNIIVGQNDTGKTALLEALNLRFVDRPHRSLETVPYVGARTTPTSRALVSFVVGKEELISVCRDLLQEFHVPIPKSVPDHEVSTTRERIFAILANKTNAINCVYQSRNILSAYLEAYGDFQNTDRTLKIQYDPIKNEFTSELRIYSVGDQFAKSLANVFKERIYIFNAERFTLGKASVTTQQDLAPNAINLASVLHYLVSDNPSRFTRYVNYINRIFPTIKGITVPPVENQNAEIFLWPIDPILERADLAIPLSESGTGVGQVLAILYVVLNSDFPRTIIIDEPQSFLHPGAIRKLIEILKSDFSQHQYIVATHSPTVVTSANPEKLFLVKKVGAESSIEELSVKEADQQRQFLLEVGARFSDVFGADNILWVEGRTEELCFPMIVEKILKQPLLGTAILGVRHTGDFDGKYSRTIFEIYKRLSEGKGMLPPTVGFIFDREGRTQKEQEDLVRQSDGWVSFIAKRMYENYLLNSEAIAAIIAGIEGFRDDPVKADEINVWIEENGWKRAYFGRTISERTRSPDYWVENVHGARILSDLFKEFSEGRFMYNKVEHDVALTEWIIENSPEDLQEIAQLIKDGLARGQ